MGPGCFHPRNLDGLYDSPRPDHASATNWSRNPGHHGAHWAQGCASMGPRSTDRGIGQGAATKEHLPAGFNGARSSASMGRDTLAKSSLLLVKVLLLTSLKETTCKNKC